MAFNLIIVEKTDRAAEARRYLIAVHDQSRDQAAKVDPAMQLILAFMREQAEQSRAFMTQMASILAPLKVQLAEVRAATTPEAIDQRIHDNIMVRSIRGIPTTHITIKDATKEFFTGICVNVAGALLKAMRHPQDEFEICDASGDLHMTKVFQRDGIEAAVDAILQTVTFDRDTPQRFYMRTALLPGKSFVIKRDAFCRPEVREVWIDRLPAAVVGMLPKPNLRKLFNDDGEIQK
jgi:hypothetical protein